MEFHLSRGARERYGADDLLFSYTGNAIFANVAASRALASRMNAVRGAQTAPELAVHAASLFAMGLIDELSHALVAKYRQTLDPDVLPEAIAWFARQADPQALRKLLARFAEDFPNVAVYRGEVTVDQWLAGATDDVPHMEAAFEELMLLWLANRNPAFQPFAEFFNDAELSSQTIYPRITGGLGEFFKTRPEFVPEVGTLLDVLLAPMQAAPGSLTGQLDFIREQWAEHLGDDLRQVLLAIDLVKEEDIAIWMQFHPAAGVARHGDATRGFAAEGFAGDEFVGFDFGSGPGGGWTVDAQGNRVWRSADGQGPQQPTVHEYEAFSPDQAWMPTVVLMAKSTYVWLEQLSKKYQRHIHRLDQIPAAELALLASRGLNGLWLIGLWERSKASQTIKRMRGQADAVASAYSVADYRIAEDLGGEPAYRHLRDQAAAAGIRLASDMVPNHMGIDSTWVMEHPEWFLSRPDSPFPVYQFEGPDLSPDPRVEIKIEDHYFDQTDAAVVFRRREQATGKLDFVYHGNDGTTFAWNDTAQLNYGKAEVREQVMQTILEVARLFPIIRFDAAMTLAKKHVQRLWFPIPGVGGSIPSRAEAAMSNEEFDALMPKEFWREVVDRVAVEVPGTLLLAEAFWLLEGYFVRTLGMHRVYNSAFMNMIRDEENAKYRSYLKKTIEFDPDILKRYVNFMSNPDERTAIDQFGSGDRYFGACTLLATLPGLPMFGHGQIEAYTEKYGMEYKRARFDEWPNEDLVARHQREIAPLLKNRQLFAGSSDFFLYDFWTDHGTVDENVFAYSNRSTGPRGQERAIVFFNNRYGGTRGTIHSSAESMDKGTGELRTRRLSEALHLQTDDAVVAAYQDTVTGLEYLRRSRDLDHHGLAIHLRAYQYVVLQNWRELRSTAEQPWDRLCDALQGAGVYNLDEALADLRLRPLHEALRQLLGPAIVEEVIEAAAEPETADAPTVEGPPAVEALKVEEKQNVEPLALIAAGTETARAADVSDVVPAPALPDQAEAEAPLPPRSEPLPAHLAPVLAQAEEFVRRAREVGGVGVRPADSGLAASLMALVRVREMPPPCSGHGIDVVSRETRSMAIWAPAVAWSVLRCLGTDSPQTLALFDELRLRAALSEIFSGLGLEGESAWRTAARVRMLLARRADAALSLRDVVGTAAFWDDADVRWLAGVTMYEGKTFFHKELFTELMCWMGLPDSVGAGVVASAGEPLGTLAERAGFQVAEFVTLVRPAALPMLEEVSVVPVLAVAEVEAETVVARFHSEGRVTFL